ncbi:SHOCT domain-containing protein [Actinophytocola sp.]|uniref:SHOCT domain-containing protein n=1 Tax=Actinophytocola sp. TaxID=1872138 RepID=UPI00389A67A2
MSWQDELAQLDSALASGQISADEYRTRRDRVIAQASGQSAPEQPQQPQQQGGDPTQVFRPVNPQAQQPAFGDRTQIVPGQGGDRTQVVGQGDADSTQIVSNKPVPQFPPRPVPPPWETHQPQQPNMSPPPWANEELPPEFGQQSWPRQGPEVFEEKSGGGTGRTVGIIVAVVVVLALVGGAIWFFGIRDKGNNQADNGGGGTSQTQEKTTTTTSPPPNVPDGPFVELPGDEELLNHTFSIQEAIANHQPAAGEPELMQSVGVAEIGGLVTNENGLRRGIWAFKLGNGADPAKVLNAMDGLYEQAKYELVKQDDGVLVRKLVTTDPQSGQQVTVFRAHYLTDGYMVRVEVFGPDSANVESEFTDLLAKETKKFPPAS